MSEYLVGIDLGSTSLKAVVYDTAGHLVAAASRLTERFNPSADHPDWTVWEPAQIWGGTAEALREAVAQLDDPRAIRGVAVTGMGMDGLPIAADGSWLYPFISWLDPRTAPQMDWWIETIGHARTFAVGGNPLWAINSALRIKWLQEHEPAILDRTDKWLLIEDFLNFMLCGERATDYSMASCTMLFDQTKLDWSDEMCALSGIPRSLLPAAHPAGTLLGQVHAAAAAATGLPVGTPVVLGGHDHLCGALPVGAFAPGVVLDVTGTWEIVSTVVANPPLNEAVRATGVTIQAHVARGMHAAWASTPAGEALEWFRRQWPEDDGGDWGALIAAAQSAPAGANGVLFLPHVSGSTCPVVDPASMGAFVGLRSATTRADLLRGLFEGLDYQFLDILRSVEAALGGADGVGGAGVDRIVAVGGATRNAFWMQNKADVVGKPVEVPSIEEATPLGAAMLAGLGVGIYADTAEAFAAVRAESQVYEPDTALGAAYADGFAHYAQLYPALAELHHQLAAARAAG